MTFLHLYKPGTLFSELSETLPSSGPKTMSHHFWSFLCTEPYEVSLTWGSLLTKDQMLLWGMSDQVKIIKEMSQVHRQF